MACFLQGLATLPGTLAGWRKIIVAEAGSQRWAVLVRRWKHPGAVFCDDCVALYNPERLRL